MGLPTRPNRRDVLTAGAAGFAAACLPRAGTAQESFSTEINLAVDTSRVETSTLRRSDEQRIETSLKKRLTLFHPAGEGSVRLDGLSRIRVHVPVERVTPAQLKALVQPAQLHVYHLQDLRTGENADGRYEVSVLSVTGGGKEQQSATRFFDLRERKPLKPEEFFKKCPLLLTTADVFPKGASVVSGNGLMAVRVQFTDAGTRKLESFMRRRGEILGVVLDGEIVSMTATTGERPKKKPKGQEDEREIPQLDIFGGFNSVEEANYLAAIFNAGSLPVPLKVLDTRLIAEKS